MRLGNSLRPRSMPRPMPADDGPRWIVHLVLAALVAILIWGALNAMAFQSIRSSLDDLSRRIDGIEREVENLQRTDENLYDWIHTTREKLAERGWKPPQIEPKEDDDAR